jgi:hypothetical protein
MIPLRSNFSIFFEFKYVVRVQGRKTNDPLATVKAVLKFSPNLSGPKNTKIKYEDYFTKLFSK